MGHARAIAGLDLADQQLQVFQQIISQNLSVRQTENLVRNFTLNSAKKQIDSSNQADDKEILSIQDKLTQSFETRVKIDRNAKGKGKFNIYFSNDKQLNDILEKLGYFD